MRRFPMTFRVFLRHQFGGRLHADRLLLFKKYLLEDYLETKEVRDLPPEDREAAASAMRDKLISTLSREGIGNPNWYFYANERIQEWRKANRVRQRRAAIKTRWDKEKQKKILALTKPGESVVSKGGKCGLVSKKDKNVTGSYPKK